MHTSATAAVWLTASADVLRERIYSASRFDELAAEEKAMVEKFPGRTDRYNQLFAAPRSSHDMSHSASGRAAIAC